MRSYTWWDQGTGRTRSEARDNEYNTYWYVWSSTGTIGFSSGETIGKTKMLPVPKHWELR